MASNGENAMLMQRMEDSSLRQLWRLTHVPHQRPEAGRLPKEMLKMKIDPTMCMKTKERVTKWTTICRAFWPKIHRFRDNGRQSSRLLGRECTDCAVIRGETGVARTSSRPFAPAAIDMTATRCAPSPPPAKRGAPFPLRLVKAPAAVLSREGRGLGHAELPVDPAAERC